MCVVVMCVAEFGKGHMEMFVLGRINSAVNLLLSKALIRNTRSMLFEKWRYGVEYTILGSLGCTKCLHRKVKFIW